MICKFSSFDVVLLCFVILAGVCVGYVVAGFFFGRCDSLLGVGC